MAACSVTFPSAVRPTGPTAALVGSKGNIAALRECVNSFLSVEDNHKLSDLHPSLKADSYPSRTDCRRTAPTLCGSRDDNAAPASGTADEPGFRHGQDRETFCVSQNVIGNCSLRDLLEALNDRHGLIDVVLHAGM